MNNNQYTITSRPRHLRHLFFIDETFAYENLLKLIIQNQNLWGGRHNPIIPVSNNTITKEYTALLEYYDPDYIYYSFGVDIDILKQNGYLKHFNPTEYKPLIENDSIEGIYSYYLLSKSEPNSKIISTVGDSLWQLKSPLFDFYELNFGFNKSYIVRINEYSRNMHFYPITKANFGSLNQIIYNEKIFNTVKLSSLNLNTIILKTSKPWLGDFQLEMVLAKDKSSKDDLLYYWNRKLYEYLNQNIIYLTIEELSLLHKNGDFDKVLSDLNTMGNNNIIRVSSSSHTSDEINNIMKIYLPSKRFVPFIVEKFPFEIDNAYSNEGEKESTISQNSEKSIYHIPKLSFIDNDKFNDLKWAIDIKIEKVGRYNANKIKYPYTTNVQRIFKVQKGRVNRLNNLSLHLYNLNKENSIEVEIPTFSELMRQCIQSPVIAGKYEDTGFYVEDNPDSRKLKSLIKLFDNNLDTIQDFFHDKFWFELFEDLIKSNKDVGDVITFKKLFDRCISIMKTEGIVLEVDSHNRSEKRLTEGLANTMQELCAYNVFHKGFELKCYYCSSSFWYHINEVRDKIKCKGCLEDFDLEVNPYFSYKLSDLVKNNIYKMKHSESDGEGKIKPQPSGNLTVLRTLLALKTYAMDCFEYSTQVNLISDYVKHLEFSDIDIVCTLNGKLVIGEAKHNSKLFSDDNYECLKKLVEIYKVVQPDRIVLSCSFDDKTNNKSGHKSKIEIALEKLKQMHSPWKNEPEIIPVHEYPPTYLFDYGRYFQ